MGMDLINPPTILHQMVDIQATDHRMIKALMDTQTTGQPAMKDSMDIHQVAHKTIVQTTNMFHHKMIHHNNHPGPTINTFHHNQMVNDQMAMAMVTSIHKTVTDIRSHQ